MRQTTDLNNKTILVTHWSRKGQAPMWSTPMINKE